MYECGPVVGGEVPGPGWSGRWRAGCAACKGRHGGHLAYTTTAFLPARSFGNYSGLGALFKKHALSRERGAWRPSCKYKDDFSDRSFSYHLVLGAVFKF